MKRWMDKRANETRGYITALRGGGGEVCGYFTAFLSNFDVSIWIDFAFIPTMPLTQSAPLNNLLNK